jgi:signal transduction histidine kinase
MLVPLCVLLLAFAVPRCACSAEPFTLTRDSPFVLLHGEYVLSDSSTPPARHADWQPVELPDTWRNHDRHRQGLSAWYRFAMPDTPPEVATSLYLWRFSMNAAAYFNDEHIGSGGSFDEPIARNWNRPFLWAVPRTAWQPDDNWLYVRLRVYPGFGNLTPPVLGPTDLLLPAYESRYFWQITLSQWSMVLTVVLAIIGIAFSLADRRNSTYLFFSLAAFAWTTYSLNLFLQHIPVPARAWWWLVHASIDVFTVCVVLFAHRLVGVPRPRVERLIVAAAVTVLGLYAVWDLPTLARWNNVTHLIMMLGPVYLAGWLGWRVFRYREPDAMVLFGTLLILLGFGAHDLMLNSLIVPDLWATRSFVTQFGAPAMLLVLVVHLARRLSQALAESRVMNEQLETRVAAASTELAEGYARRRRLEVERAASAERERIYQDLHDDVGAKLLSLIYAAGDSPPAGMAREALQEIRSIVAANAVEGEAFAVRLANWRSEAESRCEQTRFALSWQEQLTDSEPSSLVCYHLERILRELVSNALEHSHGRQLSVRIDAEHDRIGLAVEDDGVGMEIVEGSTHNGLLGIRRRVARLGGEVHWYRGALGGVGARVTLPLPPIGG